MNYSTGNFLQFLISFKYLFLRIVLFWVITQRSGNFLTLEDGANRLSRNVGKKNYHYTLRNSPGENRFQLLRGGSL